MSTNYQTRENDVIYVPPTLLVELGNFFEAVLYLVTIVIESITGAFFDSGNGYGNTNRAANYREVF